MVCRPSITHPVVTFLKRIGTPKRAESCGVWYRRILARIQAIDCIATCDDTSETTNTTGIGTSLVVIRAARFFAHKTIIRNTGNQDALIYEGDAFVFHLPLGEEWVLPVAGKLELKAKTASSTTDIQVVTFMRCACNVLEPAAEIDDEAGGFLV